ncbi:LamG-like jellyroll fold domain-containing protein [Marivirga harenae]|uniref:LamG-like jellyroll fold domain-containing protein n=1 Tax=Marivirga harenae TaxID=2010992 RepID=UPI0026DF2D93|nr:LamG-like jellyroll fold domain-containing protein [Marivirga harenae]WKV11483.1 LamG-like jellyroll fold domain-containing protein [Marivirga harenae]
MRIIYNIFFLSFCLLGVSINILLGQGTAIKPADNKSTNNQIESVLASYRFSGNADDLSGNGSNGIVDGQVLTDDRFGRPDQAFQFLPANGGIQTPLVEQPDALSVWFQTTAESGTLLSWGSGTEGVLGYTVHVLSTGIEFVYNSGDGVTDGSTFVFISRSGLNDGNWHHLVIGVDEIEELFTFYVDNEVVGTEVIDVNGILWAGINSVGLEIGPSFNGRIDDVFLYLGNIFSSEINTIYHASGWEVPDNTLVLNYDFNDAIVEDLSGFGFDLLNVSATSVPDRFNTASNALGLDGVDQFSETSGVPIYDNISLSAWFNTAADFSGGYRSFADLFGLGALSVGPTNLLEGTLRTGDQDFLVLSSDVPVNDGLWHHAVITYDGFTAMLYLDNEVVDVSTEYNEPLFQTSVSTFLNIGFIFEPGNIRYFNGLVDDVNYYNYGISQAEVISLYSDNNWPNTAPIASYPFNGNANDESGNYLDGSVNGANLTEDRFNDANRAYNFNGSSSYIAIADDPLFDLGLSNDVAVSGWFNTFAATGVLFDKSDGEKGYFAWFPSDGSNRIQFFATEAGVGSSSIVSNPGYNDGQWHHFVMQLDRDGGMSIHIDGVLDAENTSALSDGFNPDNFEDFLIGVAGGINNAGLNGFFNGELDDFKVFNSLLTDAEIGNLYNKNAWPNVGQVRIKINQSSSDEGLDPYPPGNTLSWGKAFDFTDDEFEFILNGDNGKPYGDFEGNGFIDLLGTPIIPPNGLNFVRLTDATRAYRSDLITSIGFLGSARTGDETGWQGDDTDMTYVGNGVFELLGIELFDGEWKIRANDDWNFANWGSFNENPGELFLFAENIPIAAGTYDIAVDVINNTYSITEAEPASSLLASYFFNNNFDDDSGNTNNGTGVNASFGNDRFGTANQAATFNGSDAYISIPNNAAFNFGDSEDIVISGWFRTTTSGVLFDKSNFLSGYFSQILNEGNLQFFMVQEGGSSAELTTNGIFNDGNWHHYVIQIDRDAGMEIFIDGELENINEVLTDGINPDMAEDFLIGVAGGVENAGLNSFFQGAQDDIHIYNETLTLEEIQALYSEGGWPITGIPRIANINPRSGKIGSEVTISGVNFSSNNVENIVSFNGIRANVISSSSTELKVEVPLGASYGPIYLTTNNSVAQSSRDFNVIFDGNGLGFDNNSFDVSNPVQGNYGLFQGSIISADFDQDGVLDIAVIETGTQFAVFRNVSQNDGEILFDLPSVFNVSSGIEFISKGDFNGDGKWDIAIAQGQIVSVFINNSTGAGNISFQNVFELTLDSDLIRDMEVADMNGDGKQDILIKENFVTIEEFSSFNSFTVTTLENITEAGIVTFSVADRTDIDGNFGFKLRDLNGDKKTDFLSSNPDVLLNTSNFQTNSFGFSSPFPLTPVGTTVDITTGDFDNDGKTDFALTEDNGGGYFGVYANSTTNPLSGEVSFLEPKTFETLLIPPGIGSGDFDGDGLLDIASVTLEAEGLSIFKNNTSQIGDISFQNRVDYVSGGGFDMAVGDFNNDGKVDIINSVLTVYRNNLQSADEITPPQNQATNLSFSNIASDRFTVNFSAATGHSGKYLVLRNSQNTPSFIPENGFSYKINDIFGSDRVIYIGTETSFVDSLLNQNTRYFYSIFTFNGSGNIAKYLAQNPLIGDETTLPLDGLAAEPTEQPGSFEVSNFDEANGSFQVNYVAPSATVDGYLVVRRLNNTPIFVPADGQSYSIGQVNSTDSVVYVGANTQFLEQNFIADNRYQYLIFSFNGSEGAINYLQNNPLSGSFNIPAAQPLVQPTSFTVNSVGPNSVNFSFTSTENVSGFVVLRNEAQSPANIPEDFTTYQYADQINEDVVIYSGSSNSIIDNNLNPQTEYFYAIFAYNGSGDLINYLTSSPLTGSLTTTDLPNLASQPQAQPTDFVVTSKTENAAELTFTESDASGYLVVKFTASNSFFNPADGIIYNSGDQFGNSTITYVGEGNVWNESGLMPETNYNFKIYGYNGTGNEINYLQSSPLFGNLVSLTNPPNTQAADFTVSNQTFTSYTISFSPNFDNADGYIAIKKEGGTPPITAPAGGTIYAVGDELIEGEEVIAIGAINQIDETDLTAETYSYAIYSYNGESDFINYNTINPLTGSASVLVDNTAPIIQNIVYDTEVNLGGTVNISVEILDEESEVGSVEIQYIIPGTNSINNPTIDAMTASGNDYTYQISNLTASGLEFKVVAENGVDLVSETDIQSVTVLFTGDGLQIPFNSFGSAQSNYRIVSVPMTLNNNRVNDVFGSELGNYGDKSKWRMFRYSGEQTEELSGSTPLIPGRGYWLIVNDNEVSFFTGSGQSVNANVEQPYEIVLNPGWNQIGNPFAHDINWSDVQDLNEQEFELRVFNGSFSNGNSLQAFSGGFVNWPNSSTFTMRVPSSPAATGQNRSAPSKDQEGWELNLTLEKDGIVNQLTGLGMHANAKNDLDSKDQFNLPRFLNFIDLNHDLSANGYFVSKDIVKMQSQYNWEFDIESNLSLDGMTITWEIPNNSNYDQQNSLVLWDPSSANLIDMKRTSQYQLRNSDGRNLRIIYGSPDYVNSLIEVNSLQISDPFPNPSSGALNIQFYVPENEVNKELIFELFNLKGALVNKYQLKPTNVGHNMLQWKVSETSNEDLSGVYMLRVSNDRNSINKKIVMK